MVSARYELKVRDPVERCVPTRQLAHGLAAVVAIGQDYVAGPAFRGRENKRFEPRVIAAVGEQGSCLLVQNLPAERP